MENCLNLTEEISALTDSELSDRLVEFGFSRTPVTNMTRKYLEKQLVTKLQGKLNKKIDMNEVSLNGLTECQRSIMESPKNGTSFSLEVDNHSCSINSAAEKASTFYAVYCPTDNTEIGSRVFFDQEEALKYAKKNKRSRFKPFKSCEEAMNFATHGITMNGSGSIPSPVSNQPNLPASSIDGASRFKGPKSQDLVQLRKAIESGNLNQVKRMVWENPRYLVSSGDTPSILQEGARYNALHIASKVMNPEMTSFLLETVSDMKFIQLLYGIESEENCRQRAIFLLDLYLNTPDKSLNETPLHLAVKFGAVPVVQILVSYPECDRNRPNKFQQIPNEIICSRLTNPSKAVVEEIEQLLRDAFFVPVLRSIDAVLQPQVGELFSSKQPLVTNNDPLSPHMDVTAYAGPMEFEEAQNFRRRWKTPPRLKAAIPLRIARLNDLDRGLEREGRDLAKQFNIKWKEYWPFLGVFTDFCTQEGLSKLEQYLKEKFDKMSEELASIAAKEKATQSTPPEGRGDITRESSANQTLSPMSDLCVALDSCTLTDQSPPSTPLRPPPVRSTATATTHHDSSASLSPILYIEKTCQVLARRLADGILNGLANEDYSYLSKTLKDVLHAEVSNMQKLIISFKANTYFSTVNFQLMHSRIAMLIPFYLNDSTQSYDLMLICSSLQLLASRANDDSSEEESEKSNNYRGLARVAAPLRLGEQVACLAQQLIHALNRPGGSALGVVDKEEDVMAMWARGSECSCTWSASPPMHRNMRRGASLKRGLARQAESGRVWTRDEAKQVVQRIPSVELDDDQSETSESEETRTAGDSVSVGDETDAFFTPPSSVTSEEADMEVFDSPEEGTPVFIEGKMPTKLDVDVLRALNLELVGADPDQYPNIWRWRHQVLQFSEHERQCWPSPLQVRQAYSSPPSSPVSTSALSPMKSPLVHRKPHSMQQMWGSPEPPFTTPPKRRLNL